VTLPLVSKVLKKMTTEVETEEVEVEEEVEEEEVATRVVQEVEIETKRRTLKELTKNTQPYEESEGPSYYQKR